MVADVMIVVVLDPCPSTWHVDQHSLVHDDVLV